MRAANGRDHPEAFSDDEVGTAAVRMIQAMQQHTPGPPVREFLVRQVGLSGPEAEAMLVRLAGSEAVEPPPDPRESARRACERLSGFESIEQWVAEFRRMETEDRIASGDPAARGWARLDAAERVKLLAWANRDVRPGMNRTTVDYELLLRQPGAIDGLRTTICNVAAGTPPASEARR